MFGVGVHCSVYSIMLAHSSTPIVFNYKIMLLNIYIYIYIYIYSQNMTYLAIHGQQCGTVPENVQPNIVVLVASLVSLGGEATRRFAS